MSYCIILGVNLKGVIMRKVPNFTYKYRPAIYEYIMKDFILNENKREKDILALLVKGKTCSQIANEIGYSERTIQRRRKDIYEKTKDLMI